MSEVMKKYVRRGPDEWRRLIDEFAGSGLTQVAFCKSKGVSVASFGNWKHRLAQEESTPSSSWVELGTLSDFDSPRWDIELQLGDGICLRLRRC
jgi:hypothetical protein